MNPIVGEVLIVFGILAICIISTGASKKLVASFLALAIVLVVLINLGTIGLILAPFAVIAGLILIFETLGEIDLTSSASNLEKPFYKKEEAA